MPGGVKEIRGLKVFKVFKDLKGLRDRVLILITFD